MKAHQLLDKPSKWTKGIYARDAKDKPANPKSSRAVKWCVMGAIEKCYSKSQYEQKICKLAEFLGGIYPILSKFNDNSQYEDIVSVLKEANI